MHFPNLTESILSHGLFLILGPALSLFAIRFALHAMRDRQWLGLLVPLACLLLGLAMSYTNYGEVWTSWSFRRELDPGQIRAVIVHPVSGEYGTESGPILTIRKASLIDELLSKLDDSKMFWRDHETFEAGYSVRFETADGSQSAARLIVWTKSSKGQRYVVIPQTSPETNIHADLYESYKFVSSLVKMVEAAQVEGQTVIE